MAPTAPSCSETSILQGRSVASSCRDDSPPCPRGCRAMADLVSLTVTGQSAHLRIENGALNILSVAARKDLLRHVLDLEKRQDIRIVLLEGAGEKAFSVGS